MKSNNGNHRGDDMGINIDDLKSSMERMGVSDISLVRTIYSMTLPLTLLVRAKKLSIV